MENTKQNRKSEFFSEDFCDFWVEFQVQDICARLVRRKDGDRTKLDMCLKENIFSWSANSLNKMGGIKDDPQGLATRWTVVSTWRCIVRIKSAN